MRKMELVYLHELLVVIRHEYERQVGHDIDCQEYDQLEIHPLQITLSKSEHARAVRALASDLATAFSEEYSADANTDPKACANHGK